MTPARIRSRRTTAVALTLALALTALIGTGSVTDRAAAAVVAGGPGHCC